MEVQNTCIENFQIESEKCESKLPEYIEKCINNVIKNQGFKTHKVIHRKIPVDGGNYLAELYDITIQGFNKDGEKELNIFVKNVVPVAEDMSFFCIADVYTKECFFYKEISKMISKLEEQAGVPLNERFRSAKGYDESTKEAILLDNLAKKGFKTHDRMKMLPLKFFELCMKEMAKLHSMTFVLQRQAPEFFKKKVSPVQYAITFNESWVNFMSTLSKISIKCLSEDMQRKAEDMLPDLIEKFKKDFTDDSFPVLCHGDFRAANILIRVEEGEIQEVVPVDYQILNYGNPANDIMYFLYGCNDREFRSRHIKYLVDLYYETMDNYLKYFDIDVKQVFPRDLLDSELNKRRDLGAMIAICYYPFFYAPEDTDLSITDGIDKCDVRLDAETVKRIEEIIEEVEEAKKAKTNLW